MQKTDQNNLWLQLMCYISTSHTSYIFQKWTWGISRLEPLEGSEVCDCQNQKRVSVLVNFQNKIVQYKLPDYILDMLFRVVI